MTAPPESRDPPVGGDGLAEFTTARNRALVALDIEWAREHLSRSFSGAQPSDELLLLTLHKARHHCTAIHDHLRIDSARWLKDRGFNDLMGHPINEPTELPR